MMTNRHRAVAIVVLAALAVACSSRAAKCDPEPRGDDASDVVPPQRGGRPAACGLWRPADLDRKPDRTAFLPTPEMEEIGLAGPPIEWSRVRDVAIERVAWLAAPNTVVSFRIDDAAPRRPDETIYVLDDRLILYRVRPSNAGGRWRVDEMLGEEEAERVTRILAGGAECARLE